MLNVHVAILPLGSVAVYVTTVVPTGNVAPGLYDPTGITKPVEDKQGVPYETLAGLKGVEQLARFDDTHAMMLVKADNGVMELKTLVLP